MLRENEYFVNADPLGLLPILPKPFFNSEIRKFQKFDISRKTCYNNSTKEKECGENEFMSRKCNPQTR